MRKRKFPSFVRWLSVPILLALQTLSPVGSPSTSYAHASSAANTSFSRQHRILQAETGSNPRKICKPVDACEMCTKGDYERFQECSDTGRRQRYECTIFDEDGEETGEHESETRSCKRTEADEEFAMIRLQVLCFLIGAVALVHVRRQKVQSASLFEQRKHGAQQKPRYSDVHNNNDEEIELSRMEMESIPLIETSSNPLEVV